MRKPQIAGLLAATVLASHPSGIAPARELDNIAAFARLFGVVRYFYPSDPAEGLDWNSFAVKGVREVRTAADAKALAATLQRLLDPLGPGIEIGRTLSPRPPSAQTDAKLVAWRYFGAGLDGASRPYDRKRTNRARVSGIDGFVTLMQTLPADRLVGKHVRLRGQVRAVPADSSGWAALWLRVDRPNQAMGFFDNMSNRQIRISEWREYTIEGPVAPDATNVAFGVMASGAVAADFDAVELSIRDGDGTWSAIAINDPGFEEPPASKGWGRAGTSKLAEVSRPVEQAPQERQFLRLSAPSSATLGAELFEDLPPTAGEFVDVDLGSGLKARVALVLSDSQAALAPKAPIDLRTPDDQWDLNTRLADVVVAWNVFRHFYPYWTEAAVDWDARLLPHLMRVYDVTGRETHLEAMRLLVADIRDGHGGVNDGRPRSTQTHLPVRFGGVEGKVVVTGSDSRDVPVGAIVSTIDGASATDRLAAAMKLSSGTKQWQQDRALRELATCSTAREVTLGIEDSKGTTTKTVRCEARQPPAEKRPEPITELSPGIFYVDITRARMSDLKPELKKLAAASGVVFDLRGYPTDAGAQILPHLLNQPETDRWMHVPKIVGPFGRLAGWHSIGWNMQPMEPRLTGKIVFLTDGRAISYAESVMGYVADRKLATIVGSTTAGANGNVVAFLVPSGLTISFTGMRVTGHDGRTPHHLAGVKPDVPVEPTIAGLRAGRDEVLERGLSLIR